MVTRSPYDQIKDPNENSAGLLMLYFYALIYILQTITTVGYGNSTYGTYLEYSFALVIESISLVYNGLILVAMTEVSTLSSNNFDAFLDNQLDILDALMIKLQKANKGYYIKPSMVDEIRMYVRDAYLYDHNLIVEHYPFYPMLTPPMQ